jgi:DNA-binding MarR family transcriptional regulator
MGTAIIAQLAQLRDLLDAMERDLGIDSLTPNERDILLAFYSNASKDDARGLICSTDVVRAHPTVCRISQPTFHRTLRRLIERGFVARCEDLPQGMYRLSDGSGKTA